MTTLLGTGNPDCKLQIHLTLKSPKPRFAHSVTTMCYRLQQVLFLQLMLESKAFIRLWFQTCWLVPLNPSSARSPFPIGLSSFLSKKPQLQTALEAWTKALSFQVSMQPVFWLHVWRLDSCAPPGFSNLMNSSLVYHLPSGARRLSAWRENIQSHGTMYLCMSYLCPQHMQIQSNIFHIFTYA